MKNLILVFTVLALAAPGCSNQSSTSAEKDVELSKLMQWMSGTFTSSNQANEDDSFFDITLHMYPIWPSKSDENSFYLYVEQAVTFKQEEPYRQRVYRVSKEGPNKFTSEIFTIPEDENYIGAFRKTDPLGDLSVKDLSKKKGCAVNLSFEKKAFRGSTDGKSCKSDLQGASYATSEVVIEKDQIYSWDRGFDDSGEQVWGAEKGGYIFERVEGQ